MFRYNLLFHETGEIIESQLSYKYPHTALIGAKAFLRGARFWRERSPKEEVTISILDRKDEVVKLLPKATIAGRLRKR